MPGPSKCQIRNKKLKRAQKLQSIPSTFQKNEIVCLGEEMTVLKSELSETIGEISDIKLDNNQRLNIVQSATLDADIAIRTAENLVRKMVALASNRVISSAQH